MSFISIRLGDLLLLLPSMNGRSGSLIYIKCADPSARDLRVLTAISYASDPEHSA